MKNLDLDITVDEIGKDSLLKNDYDNRSDWSDFDVCAKKEHENGFYTKIDIRVNPEPSFEIIEFEGENYNVSKKRDILFWKKKYADKGVGKHKNDLHFIEFGKHKLAPVFNLDDLPVGNIG